MTVECPIMVVPRNHVCCQIKRLANMVYQRSGNLIKRRKIAQTRKELDPEHEVQLVLHGSGHRAHKATFFFRWGIRFDQLFGSVTAFHPTINRSINSGHCFAPLPQYQYTFIFRYDILPLRYLSSTKQGKIPGRMSAKGVKNYRFFHLLRFLCMEAITKRAKRPTLSGTGEQVLVQYERRLRIEEDLTSVTIRNYLSDLRHFAAWCEFIWKQGREEGLAFTPERVTTPTITDYRTYLQQVLHLK